MAKLTNVHTERVLNHIAIEGQEAHNNIAAQFLKDESIYFKAESGR